MFLDCSLSVPPGRYPIFFAVYGTVILLSFRFALRYIYRRFGIIRILGIPVGRYASVLFLFFAQRCGGKCQHMGGNRGIIAMVAYAAALYGIFHGVLLRKRVFERMKIPYRRLRVSGVLLLLTGLLFIPIRGGFTVSTMNTGKVYFSTDQRLNHAAINPAFSLMESLSKQKDFGSQYRFMEADAADRIFPVWQTLPFRCGTVFRQISCSRLRILCIRCLRQSVPMCSLSSWRVSLRG